MKGVGNSKLKATKRPPSLLRWIVVQTLDYMEPAAGVEPATF